MLTTHGGVQLSKKNVETPVATQEKAPTSVEEYLKESEKNKEQEKV